MKADTIYAPSTAIGGAIAVLRVSGPEAARTATLLSRDVTKEPQKLLFTHVQDGAEVVDDCMAVYLPGSDTYTGEDMMELDCHGGMQTVRRLLELLNKLGFRPAEGGEFTRRAFLAGKMDLSQAEAVMDLITAGAEQSRKAALCQLHGSVSRAVAAVEDGLLDALSALDAAIDFPDEAEADALQDVPRAMGEAADQLARLLADGRRNRVLRDGLQVAFFGRPNVGKSSLLNALLGEERAIVTDEPGTTRDVLSERVSFDGVPVRLIDTAGLRETNSAAERMGVDRTRALMTNCDVHCVLIDGSVDLADEDRALLRETAGTVRLILLNKCDLPRRVDLRELETLTDGAEALSISAKTDEGVVQFKKRLLALAGPNLQDASCITNERHLHLLDTAREALLSGMQTDEPDCMATDVKLALHALGGVTGTDVDASVIDRIFERFCVGK